MAKILSAKSRAQFLAQQPTVLGTHVNVLEQTITFYEHPTKGDDFFIMAGIGDYIFQTSFFELDDMTADHGEYTPQIFAGSLWFGDMHEEDLPY